VVVLVVVCALDLLILAMPTLLRRRGVQLWWRTMFGPALVFDSQDDDGRTVRLLNVRGKYQSVGYVDEALRWELACLYHQYFAQMVDIAGMMGEADEAASADASPQAALPYHAVVVGGGGYSFPKWLVAHCPQLQTTVVEIDPKITQIAREQFFVDELMQTFDTEATGALQLVCADGWEWLRSCGQRFDLVVNDAFSGKRPLGPLGSAEGARLIHERLTPSGLYLANVIAPLEGRGSEHLREVVEVFRAEFAYVWVIPEDEEEPHVVADNVLVASDRKLPISKRYLR
jgi:spermidine synthase